MEKKTMGGFMSALRKANGMTQQDVADHLNISNKAVSRWERDECAPDISLIPALAELLGVTCDELLKGERITANTAQPERSTAKVDKQLKALVNRSLSNFNTLSWIALALSLVGYVCMLSVSYGLYYPVIGFGVMMLFTITAFILEAIALNRIKYTKENNELFENIDDATLKRFNLVYSKFSFTSFFISVSVVILSLPLLCNDTEYVNAVISAEDYFSLLVFIVLILATIFSISKDFFVSLFAGCEHIAGTEDPEAVKCFKLRRLLNLIQLGALLIVGIYFLLGPFGFLSTYGSSLSLFYILQVSSLLLLVSCVATFIIFHKKYPQYRQGLFLTGLRNSILAIPVFLFSSCYTIVTTRTCDGETYRITNFNPDVLGICLTLILIIIIVFNILKKRNNK